MAITLFINFFDCKRNYKIKQKCICVLCYSIQTILHPTIQDIISEWNSYVYGVLIIPLLEKIINTTLAISTFL